MNQRDLSDSAHREAVSATLAWLTGDEDLFLECCLDARHASGDITPPAIPSKEVALLDPMERAGLAPEEFARHLEEQRALMQQAQSLIHYAHSRSGLLARFLQRMADRVDPTGEARRNMERPG
jgi:hypothetical protein